MTPACCSITDSRQDWPFSPDEPFTIHQARDAGVDTCSLAWSAPGYCGDHFVGSTSRARCPTTSGSGRPVLTGDARRLFRHRPLRRLAARGRHDAGPQRGRACSRGWRLLPGQRRRTVAQRAVCQWRAAGSRRRSGGGARGPRDERTLRTALDLGRFGRPDVALAGDGLDGSAWVASTVGGARGVGRSIERGQRGVVQLRELAPIVDPGSESFGESATRRRWHCADLPWPTTQIPIVCDGVEIFRLDLGLEDLMFAVEYKGRRWHTAHADREHDANRLGWLDANRAYQITELDHTNVFGRTRTRMRCCGRTPPARGRRSPAAGGASSTERRQAPTRLQTSADSGCTQAPTRRLLAPLG